MRDKHELREELRARRASLTEEDRTDRSARAVQRLLDLTELRRPRMVALYAALPQEADPAAARPPLEGRGARIALPRVHADGDVLQLVAVGGGLAPGFRGILEPAGPALPLDELDAIVVPGVAFDEDGGRLGQGGGHYDRLLAAVGERTTAIGFAFAFQVVEHVPVLDHDRPVDVVVTDQATHRRDGGTGPPA